MRNVKKFVATLLLTSMICVLPVYASESSKVVQNEVQFNVTKQSLTTEQKLEDLDLLCKSLEEKHIDLFGAIVKKEMNKDNKVESDNKDEYYKKAKEKFYEDKQKIADNISDLSDMDFYFELLKLTVSIGDAHTNIALKNANEIVNMFPFSVKKLDNEWRIVTINKFNEQYLGNKLVAVNEYNISDVYNKISEIFSHEYNNTSRLDSGFAQWIYVAEALKYLGITEDISKVTLTVQDNKGDIHNINLTSMAANEKNGFDMVSIKSTTQPKTAQDRKKIYHFLELNKDTFYIQYNSCVEDEKLPMKQFVTQVEDELKSNKYKKVIVDLRYNGGGSDGLFIPMIEKLVELQKQNEFQMYTLIGAKTFSSAVTTAAMMKEAGSIMVGEDTGNNVNHYGSTKSFKFKNLPFSVSYSTKYIDVTGLLESAKPYGYGPLIPDIEVTSTLNSYIKGIDDDVEKILKD